MRAILFAFLAAALMLAAPAALADGSEHAQKGRDTAAAHAPDADDRRNETAAEKAAERENRSAAFETLLAKVKAYRAAWLENASAIREACHAVELSENATKEERAEKAHCVRDGYRAWRELHRVELREMRDQLRALLRG